MDEITHLFQIQFESSKLGINQTFWQITLLQLNKNTFSYVEWHLRK